MKSITSFVHKAEDRRTDPPYENPLSEIEDQVAGRVLVFFRSDLEIVQGRLLSTFRKVERRHVRPAKDEEFGYESDHVIFVIPPQAMPEGWNDLTDHPNTFELQVRTLFMHAWAEPQHDLSYKSAGDLDSRVRRELAWIAASAWGADEGLERVRKRLAPPES